MRYFHQLLGQLKDVTKTAHPGQLLEPPPLLNSLNNDGERLSYLYMGMNSGGDPIIFLHGFGGFFMDWPRIMTPLSHTNQVYALDLPGWGFSTPRKSIRGIEDDVETIKAFIEKLKLKNVTLVGISYGAAVAWASAASKVPEVKDILLLNPMPPFPLSYMSSQLYRTIFYVNSLKSSAFLAHKLLTSYQYKKVCKENLYHPKLITTFYLRLGYLIMKQPHIGTMLHLHAYKARTIDWKIWENRLNHIDIPVTIFKGKQDKVFNLESGKYLNELIPGSCLRYIDECGHAMVFDQHRKVSSFLMKNPTDP